jgi:hypothetical protein
MLRELARELEPVRPIPPLRAVAGAVAGAWLLALGVGWALSDSTHGLAPAEQWRTADFLAVMAGLVAVAVGASLAAIAGAVPGRDEEARAGRWWGLAGIGVAVAAGLVAAISGDGASRVGAVSSAGCFAVAVGLGLAPALLIWVFLVRTRASRPRRRAGWAAVGAVALGGVVVHATCPVVGDLHVLLGHSLAPVWAALLLAVPAGSVIRVLTRNRGPRARA